MGISSNITFSQKAFADYLKLNFPLLSDAPNLKTIEGYGVLNPERRLARRSYFIIDKQGVVRFKRVLKSGEELIPNEELLQLVQTLNKT